MTHPYATRAYAEIVAGPEEAVFEVPEWGQWVICRPIGAGAGTDAAGCYPVAAFPKRSDLSGGLARLEAHGCVSAVLVADPTLCPQAHDLSAAFDVCRPFKSHFLLDRRAGTGRYSKHHRYELRRARADVRRIDLRDHMPEWIALYAELVMRRQIAGPAAFSEAAFHALARLEGLVAFGAFAGGALIACHLWVRHGVRVHSHLSAANDAGRGCGATYLLYDAAIRFFEDAETIDFGGTAGLVDDPNDGLARFKRGFSNASRPAFLCGKILDPSRYRALSAGMETDYFPAYRVPSLRQTEEVHP